ncbi:hypothetical protein GGTG_02575 [Gaeumannomyces tritici R3-111a-1]|uniref:Rhodopsin domain-containing protein n=1 Tax=Gaeumannomyces tritici (strain R3-111a-1) TaxID=644352 RepID=J3NMR9_GAET3|nr:hypothetical protein GGTG_02575 [Gaeumannomyces tritici R3-111a-1]EJT82602.1 hypothetical protein GGTG_02575 [Gaeumannomyces tritici R3-111a-1]
MFTKLSILFLYTTLFPVPRMLLAARVVGVFLILWCLSSIIASFAMCQPFARNWDQTIQGHCGDQPLFYTCLGVINIVFEVIILAMPMPVIYSLSMPLRRKFAVAAMLSVGLAACGITVYRQITLQGLNFLDMPHSGLLATLFSGGSGLGFGSKGSKKHRQPGLETLAMTTSDDSSDLQLQPLDVENMVNVSSDWDAAFAAHNKTAPKLSTKDKVLGHSSSSSKSSGKTVVRSAGRA